MDGPSEFDKPALYRICVKGNLDPKWTDWFDGFAITHSNNETVLTGIAPDQAALHGLMAKIRDLGLKLILVQQIDQAQGE